MSYLLEDDELGSQRDRYEEPPYIIVLKNLLSHSSKRTGTIR